MSQLPARRPSRVVIEPVSPVVDVRALRSQGGARRAGRSSAPTCSPRATTRSTSACAGARVSAAGKRGKWCEERMFPEGNDRWSRVVPPASSSAASSTRCSAGPTDRRRGSTASLKKVEAGVDVTVELLDGKRIVARLLERAEATKPKPKDRHRPARDARRRPRRRPHGDARRSGLEPCCSGCTPTASRSPRRARCPSTSIPSVDVSAPGTSSSHARPVHPRTEPANAARCDRSPRLRRRLGFDVVYLPPIHPIGVVHRKGRNNSVEAAPDDVGSPWGIADHLAVHPDLGHRRRRARARRRVPRRVVSSWRSTSPSSARPITRG